jgi:hypothetical protein
MNERLEVIDHNGEEIFLYPFRLLENPIELKLRGNV